MQKPLTQLPTGNQPANASSRSSSWRGWLLAVGMAVSLSGTVLAGSVRANTPDQAPAPLQEMLSQVDAAANSRDLQKVMQYYSPNFTNTDGLNRRSLEQALTQLWKRYPDLKYKTELKSWKAEGNSFVIETVTQLTGTQQSENRQLKLISSLRSQQRLDNQQISRQEILAEQSQITSGQKPPTVKLTIPEQVNVGEEFSFDAVVQEPLGDGLLLGAALEEPVRADGLINPTTTDLELLSAGGIFKVGRAPKTPESRWLSAVVVRQDGMTLVTQRLRVVNRQGGRR